MNDITVLCANIPALCCLRLTCTYPLDTLGGITKLVVTRRNMATGTDTVVIDKAVEEVADLIFAYDDLEVVSGCKYRYTVNMLNGSLEVIQSGFATAEFSFSGISLADSTGSWHTNFGTSANQYSESYKYTRPLQYVNTLSSKFPHRVSNGEASYAVGSCNGWWVPMTKDDCGSPDLTQDVAGYRDAFIAFLRNGHNKLMRTGDGKAYIVSIDSDVTENWSPRTKLTTIAFNWTQVGEVDRPAYTNDTPKWQGEVGL